MRRIEVFWYRNDLPIRIGELGQPNESIFFEWDSEFLLNDIELSPINFRKKKDLIECPKKVFDGLPGFIADCVPDGWGRVLIKAGLGIQGIDVSALSPLDILQYVGDDSIGALSFKPSLKPREIWAKGKVSLDSLNKEIEPIRSGSASDLINAFLEAGASPNGMRPKIILHEREGEFYVGRSGLDNTNEWLVKFKAPEDSNDIGKIEYIYSLVAKEAGLIVPEVNLFRGKEEYYFASKRFDRLGTSRFHLHSLSGLLHTSPGNFSVGYEHFLKASHMLINHNKALEQILRLCIFNSYACNQDDHSKNVSFLMTPDGKWELAPFYDLTFHTTRFGEHKMGIMGDGKLSNASIIKLAKENGFSEKKLKLIIDEVKEALSSFKKYFKEFEVDKKNAVKIIKAIEGRIVAGN